MLLYMKFNLEKMVSSRMNKMKTFLKPSNLPRLLFLVAVLIILYLVYVNYLKEGMKGEMVDESEFLEGKKLVLFYADWCGHCKKVMPDWDKAAKESNGNMLKINCADESTKTQELAAKYKVDGYPTIIIFDDGTPSDYTGSRTAEDFLAALS